MRRVVVFTLLVAIASAQAQKASLTTDPPSPLKVLETEAYLKPPSEIERLVMAPRWENVSLRDLSPDRTVFLVTVSGGMPRLYELGRPHLNLGGFQVDTGANRSRNTTIRDAVGLRLVDARTGKVRDIQIPNGAGVSGASWSPDGSMVAYFADFSDRTLLCVADAKTGKSRIVSKQPLLATEVTRPDWSGDGKSIAAVFVPDPRMTYPNPSPIAAEPKVRVAAEASKHRFRTYPSLLENPRDMALLEYYTTGQLEWVEVATGRMKPIGAPAMIESVDVSPDGKYFRVRTRQKPFSYVVPTSNFGSKEEIWDAGGKVLAEIQKTPLSLAEVGGGGGRGGQNGRRNLTWRPDGVGLSFIEVEPTRQREDPPDGADREQGRGRRGASSTPQDNRKDRVMQWLAPFGKEDVKVVWTAEGRIGSVRYSQDCRTLFISDTKGQNARQYAISLDEPTKPLMISSAPSDAFYDAPGEIQSKAGSNGQPVVVVSADGAVFLSGTTYSRTPLEIAPKPFLDKVMIKTGSKQRIFESGDRQYEDFGSLLDDDAKQIVITRQSPTEVPNDWLFDPASKTATKLTQNRDLTPEITACKRFTIEVTRVDGFKFRVRATLPANWTKGQKLPAMFWFYPSEFTDQAAYDRTLRTYNKNAFPNVSSQSMALLTQLGYAYIEPDVPIVGPDGQMNDNYVSDLQNSLYAVINKLDEEGIVDRNRLAIGGHSYGAFSTANALVHTPYFKAGIAGSGDYNRSLTPFGFQTEQRQFWDDRQLYEEMSPFWYADKMNGALLMTHGMEDQNVGTNPINSERLFQALDQLGKPCALFMYPYEDHGQIAQETVLDKWARWIAWLDLYVKNAR